MIFSSGDLGLHFVAETGVVRPKGPFRDLIRSKARKKVRHRGHLAKHVNARPSTEDGEKVKSGTSQRRELVGPGKIHFIHFLLVIRDIPNSMCIIVSSFIFNVNFALFCPKFASGYLKPLLIDLNVFQHTYPHSTLDHRKKKETVLRLAFDEPAFLHTTLFHAALNLCVLRGEPSCHDLFYHYGQAIRLINDRIGAVAKNERATWLSVVLLGFRLGSPIEGHVNSLQELVDSRGGLQAIADDPSGKSVWWFVAWCVISDKKLYTPSPSTDFCGTDICASICLDTTLRFEEVIDKNEPQLQPLDPYSPLVERLKTDLTKFTRLAALSGETVDIYWGLRNLSPNSPDEAAKLIDKGQTSRVLEYKALLERLERRALLLIHSRDLVPLEPKLLVFKLFGSGVLIHVLCFLRDSPCSVALSRILSGRIREMLQYGHLQTLQIIYPETISWVVMMAGIGAIGTSYQTFFANILALMCSSSGITGENRGFSNIADFMWFDTYLNTSSMPFWNSVAIAQGIGLQFMVDRTRPGSRRCLV